MSGNPAGRLRTIAAKVLRGPTATFISVKGNAAPAAVGECVMGANDFLTVRNIADRLHGIGQNVLAFQVEDLESRHLQGEAGDYSAIHATALRMFDRLPSATNLRIVALTAKLLVADIDAYSSADVRRATARVGDQRQRISVVETLKGLFAGGLSWKGVKSEHRVDIRDALFQAGIEPLFRSLGREGSLLDTELAFTTLFHFMLLGECDAERESVKSLLGGRPLDQLAAAQGYLAKAYAEVEGVWVKSKRVIEYCDLHAREHAIGKLLLHNLVNAIVKRESPKSTYVSCGRFEATRGTQQALTALVEVATRIIENK